MYSSVRIHDEHGCYDFFYFLTDKKNWTKGETLPCFYFFKRDTALEPGLPAEATSDQRS
jgi:hypothetical protein